MVDVRMYAHEGLIKAWQWVSIEPHMLPSKLHSQHDAVEPLHCAAVNGMQGGAACSGNQLAACHTSPQQSLK